MKKLGILVAITVSIMVSMLASPVLAKGPTEAGGEAQYVPFNPNAWDHALLCIMPLVNENLASGTTIREDGKTITVSAIPLATLNEATGKWEGTHISLKWSRAWEAATNDWQPYYTGIWTKQAWAHYYFWLNGYGPVTITRDGQTEQVTEFIFFRVQYVGDGKGNSNFDVGGNFDVTIQAYK